MTLTPLELAILTEYHKAFGSRSFPPPDEIEVVKRENTGAGRFVHLTAMQATTLEGNTCDLPGSVQIEMEGVPLGLGFVLFLQAGKLDFLELFDYGDRWDGSERSWRLVARSQSGSAPNA